MEVACAQVLDAMMLSCLLVFILISSENIDRNCSCQCEIEIERAREGGDERDGGKKGIVRRSINRSICEMVRASINYSKELNKTGHINRTEMDKREFFAGWQRMAHK